MKDFEYSAATTLDEAVSLLAARGDRAKVLTGGTDLIVQLREGMREADLVVDVKKIPQLMELRYVKADGLRLGAAVPCHKIYEHPEISVAYAGLADAARIIGGWQIQSRASIGGNLCNASPAADSVPALIAYSATCQIVGPAGEREIPVEQFCTGVGKNALARGEILISLTFPPRAENSGGAYLRFIPRNEMDIAVVGAGVWLRLNATGDTIEQSRISLGAVATTPLYAEEASLWLRGKSATEESFAQAGDIARKIAKPISDKRGTAEYRNHLVGILVQRALKIATDRARGK